MSEVYVNHVKEKLFKIFIRYAINRLSENTELSSNLSTGLSGLVMKK